MINPNFAFLKDKKKIEEAIQINNEFQNVYMNCDEWSYEDCIYYIRLSMKPFYLTNDEYEIVLLML